jgi:hypothetical protein
MKHEHDYQPIPSQLPEEGLSLQAAFADAVLASKACLDEATSIVKEAEPDSAEGLRIVATLNIQLGTGYAQLAQALQHGAPGQRL